MYRGPLSLLSRMNSSPWRSSSKRSVRNKATGFASFSRNQALHAFSVPRISRHLSRAREIFCPAFPIASSFACTRSLAPSHPVPARFAASQGFSAGIAEGSAPHEYGTSPAMSASARGTAELPALLVQRSGADGRLASRKEALVPPPLETVCGEVIPQENIQTIRIVVATRRNG